MPRYRDIGVLGSGGFGEVRKVVRLEDERIFAKKVLVNPTALPPADLERFKREVRLLKNLGEAASSWSYWLVKGLACRRAHRKGAA